MNLSICLVMRLLQFFLNLFTRAFLKITFIDLFRWVSFFPISRSLEAPANLPSLPPSPDSLLMDSLSVNSFFKISSVMLISSAKYPVQWVAPKEEPAMYLGDSLYPKPGYQTSKMLIPRQFVSTIVNLRTLKIAL